MNSSLNSVTSRTIYGKRIMDETMRSTFFNQPMGRNTDRSQTLTVNRLNQSSAFG